MQISQNRHIKREPDNSGFNFLLQDLEKVYAVSQCPALCIKTVPYSFLHKLSTSSNMSFYRYSYSAVTCISVLPAPGHQEFIFFVISTCRLNCLPCSRQFGSMDRVSACILGSVLGLWAPSPVGGMQD